MKGQIVAAPRELDDSNRRPYHPIFSNSWLVVWAQALREKVKGKKPGPTHVHELVLVSLVTESGQLESQKDTHHKVFKLLNTLWFFRLTSFLDL